MLPIPPIHPHRLTSVSQTTPPTVSSPAHACLDLTCNQSILNLGQVSILLPRGATWWGVVRVERLALGGVPSACPLPPAQEVLQHEACCQPNLLGSSVFGPNDIFCCLAPALRQWHAAPRGKRRRQRPHLVSADISCAFDHIKVPLLPLLRLLPLLCLLCRHHGPRPGAAATPDHGIKEHGMRLNPKAGAPLHTPLTSPHAPPPNPHPP